MRIKSTVLNNIPGITPSTTEPSRHLYFQKIDESINLPIYLILIKIVWKRMDNPNAISKVLTGIVDLSEIISDPYQQAIGIHDIKAKTA
jgi:hypothetical protein